MDDQRLQEIENSIGRIDCPDCEMGRVSREGTFEDGQDYDRCETCDGSGMVSRFPEGHALIAEVRRLRECPPDATGYWPDHIRAIADQRDAALAERDAMRAQLNKIEAHLMRCTEPDGSFVAVMPKKHADIYERGYRKGFEVAWEAIRNIRDAGDAALAAVLAQEEKS